MKEMIDIKNEQFDSAVREKLAGHLPDVPNALWNRISAELASSNAPIQEVSTPSITRSMKSGLAWKYAVAASVLLAIGLGALVLRDSSTVPSHNAAVIGPAKAIKSAVKPFEKSTSVAVNIVPAKIKKTNTVSSFTPIINKDNNVKTPKVQTTEEIIPMIMENAVAQKESNLELEPVATKNNPVEVGAIPLNALNFLSSPTSLNDEITIIKQSQAPQKKRHSRKKDNSTKVILLNKKYEKQPDIDYQLPSKF